MPDLLVGPGPVGAIVASLIAALAGMVALVATRASKISELRQEWLISLRTAMATFTASAETIEGRIVIRKKHLAAVFDDKTAESLEAELRDTWYKLRESHAEVLLHLKYAGDLKEKGSIESKIIEEMDAVIATLQVTYGEFGKKGEGDKASSLQKQVTTLQTSTRKLLKTNWKQVKTGEPIYRATLFLMPCIFIGAVIMFLWLLKR